MNLRMIKLDIKYKLLALWIALGWFVLLALTGTLFGMLLVMHVARVLGLYVPEGPYTTFRSDLRDTIRGFLDETKRIKDEVVEYWV